MRLVPTDATPASARGHGPGRNSSLHAMESDIARKVVRLVAEAAKVPPERISPESTFADLGVDSLVAIGIIGDLEEAYGIVVPNEEAVRIRTVGEAIVSLERALGGERKGT